MNQTAQQLFKQTEKNPQVEDHNWLHTQLRSEQLKLLHHSSLRLFVILALCYTTSIIFLWQPEYLSAATVFFVSLILFAVLRLQTHRAFEQSEIAHPRRQQLWFLFFNLANLCGSFLLSVGSIMVMPFAPAADMVVLFTVTTAAIFACAVLYSIYIPAFLCFALPLTLGLSWWYWSSNIGDQRLWALAGPTLFGLMIYPVLYMNKVSSSALTRQLQNQALSKRLAEENNKTEKAHKELEHAHNSLERTVSTRTRELTLSNSRLSEEISQREEASQALQDSERRLSQALDASRLGFWDWDMEGDVIFHSRFRELFGYDLSQLDGYKGHLEHMIHPQDMADVRQALINHIQGQTDQYVAKYRIRHTDGHWVWVEDRGQAMEWNHNNRVSRMLGTRRDISFERQYEQEASLAMTVFESTSDAIFVLDTSFKFMTVNRAFREMTGYNDEDIFDKKADELNVKGNIDHYSSMYREVASEGYVQGEVVEQRKNGEPFPVWMQMTAVKDNKGQIIHYVGLFRDLTHHKETEERLRYLANFDPLTGLANRAQFQTRFHDALSKAEQHNQELALLTIDLDRFKSINDSLGHETGDELLQQVSRRLLRHTARACTTARLASDEFAIVIDTWTDKETLEELAKEIISTLCKSYIIGEHTLLIGASIGISRFPENGREIQTLASQADIAMNQSKYLGGNTVSFFDEQMRTTPRETLSIENDLRRAIQGDELEVYYQPKMNLPSGSITTAEALIRWNDPEKGLIMPGSFIAVAEETGLIHDIGRFVMKQSCLQAKVWMKTGWNIRVSVNISAHQLRKGNLAEEVESILEQTGLPARLLELEITESQLMNHMEESIEILTRIRDLGVSLSIDDFGTGYSSLSYLKRLPVDSIKIDRSFISHLGDNDNDAAITRAIIVMAHSLDLRVIAEGVEERDHINFLKNHKCDEVQGYFISRPLPISDFNNFLAIRIPKEEELLSVC